MKFSAVLCLILAAMSLPNAIAFGVLGRPTNHRKTSLFASTNQDVPNKGSDADDVASVVMASLPSTVSEAETSALVPDRLVTGVKATGAQKLRDEGLTGKGVKVAVIDDGIAANHPQFDGKVVKGKWFFPNPFGTHGTHVAGTIHMMAPDADIYDYGVFDRSGNGPSDIVAAAIREAIADGCDVINMSLGFMSAPSDVGSAVLEAHKAGIIVVCAAGNDGDANPLTNEIRWPAFFSQAISVGAVAKQKGLPTARFSNSNSQVDYAGIGQNVNSFSTSGVFVSKSGTSMASPHVCGLIAALMTKGGAYEDIIKDDASVRALLNERFAIDIGTEGIDNETGLGFLTYLTKDEFEASFTALPDFD